MANSSAIQLADLALVWSNVTHSADLAMIDSDLASDRDLTTAVLLSLLTDRRADDDDVPPSGDPRDRRGSWLDQFADIAGDLYGSRLWLLDRAKKTNETLLQAKEYVNEALTWMIEDKVVSSIDVITESMAGGIAIAVGLQRPGRDPVSFRFAHTWDHLEEDS